MSETRRGRGSAADQQRRHLAIQDYVGAAGSRTVEQIASHTGVSTMTVYRDLAELEALGLLRLVKGVVTAAATNQHESSSRFRVSHMVREKASLAEAALDLVEPGWAVMLDDSSTGIALASRLGGKAPLTVVTNYRPVADAAAQQRDVRLLMTGGEFVVWAEAFFGPISVATVRNLHADAVFMSASAVAGGVIYHPAAEAAELKREMLAASSLKVLYADHTKFTRTALHKVCDVTDFDVVIVDAETSSEITDPIAEAGVRVVHAGSGKR